MGYVKTAMLMAAMTALFMGVGYLIGGTGGAMIALLVAASTIPGLAVLGGLGASAGGASVVRGATRVTLWGALAMAATAAVGALFGVSVG